MPDSVVITGMGIMSPIGCGEEAFWASLNEGRSGAGEVTSFDTKDLPRRIACQIRDSIPVNETMGRASRLAVAAAHDAVSSARLELGSIPEGRLAVLVGTTMGETEFIEERLSMPDSDWLSTDHLKRIGLGIPGCIGLNVARSLSSTTESIGSAMDLYGACAAGNMAIDAARRRILANECDVAIAGGADGFSWLAFVGFLRLRVMADGVCRPFDERRDGLLVGEGSVLFVLERESSAKARGATIRARVLGAGLACENYHPTRPHPEGDGLSRATILALADAGLGVGDVDYVCAHGTGTPQNDEIEVTVLKKCFPKGVAFSSIKALTGHTMGAAAAVEAAACILMLEKQTLIPTWNLENVLQPCPLDAIRGQPRKTRVRHVVNNSAGFGGYNSSVILAGA